MLDDTVSQARRAADILDRLRNWSRPQRRLDGPVDLRNAIWSVLALLDGEAGKHNTAIRPDLPDGPVNVLIDQVELEQVLFNLVRNAVEALSAQTGPRVVTIGLLAAENTARLDIADNGPGVPAELVPRLFTPFTTTRPDGTGLGLALSQRLIERAGGEIAYIPGGEGAHFRVALPLAPEQHR